MLFQSFSFYSPLTIQHLTHTLSQITDGILLGPTVLGNTRQPVGDFQSRGIYLITNDKHHCYEHVANQTKCG